MIYLDSAATTFQKPASVRAAMIKALDTCASPGRGGHRPAIAAAEKLYECRERASRLFDVEDPERVIMTFNATHGLNIAIRSLVSPGDRVVISGYEHNSVTRPLNAVGARIVVADSPVFDREAAIRAFDSAITPGTGAVVINHVSNVFGFVLPVREVADMCRSRGVPFIVDASQSAGVLKVSARELMADFIAMPGHKGLYGPQGTGILIVKGEHRPLLYGGTGSNSLSREMPDFLPDGLEAGTHNMPGIAGLCEGLAFLERTGIDNIAAHERKLAESLVSGLSGIRGVRVFAADDDRDQTGVVSFELDGMASEEAGERLSSMGFAVRAGLHCAPLAHASVGTARRGTVRASVSAFNTKSEINLFLRAVEKISEG